MSVDLLVFLLASAAIAILSRNSLRDRYSYGYYRFFGLEFVLLLLISSAPSWFKNPSSPTQILSWILLAASVYLVSCGLYSLRFAGKLNADTKETARLVKTGVYRYIRHPLYSSLLFLAFGAFFKLPSLFGAMLIVGAVVSFVATARAEEVVNISKFEARYVDYMKKTKMFVPFLF